MLCELRADTQVHIAVDYKAQCCEYVADLIIDMSYLWSSSALNNTYLTAAGKKIALLVKSEKPRVEFKRIVYNL